MLTGGVGRGEDHPAYRGKLLQECGIGGGGAALGCSECGLQIVPLTPAFDIPWLQPFPDARFDTEVWADMCRERRPVIDSGNSAHNGYSAQDQMRIATTLIGIPIRRSGFMDQSNRSRRTSRSVAGAGGPVSPMPATPGLRRGVDQIAGQSLKCRQAQAECRKALRSAQDRRTRTAAGPGRLLRRWPRWCRRSPFGVSARRPGQVPIHRGADVPGPAGPCSSQTNFAGTPKGRPGGSWSRI